MKFAFSSNAFRRFSLLDTIAILAEVGYQGIEIMADAPHAYPLQLTGKDIAAIRRALDRHHLQVSNINAFTLHAEGDTYHPSWIESDPLLRQRRVEHTLRCIDLAKELGVANISTEPGGPVEGITHEEGLKMFRNGLRAIEGRARQQGIRVLIEPEPGLLIETACQFKAFFEDLDPGVFGLNFDIGHFFCVCEDPAEHIKALKESICHFHLEDIAASRKHHHLLPGEGAIDLPGVIKSIQDIGYTHFITVELYPYENQAEQAARQAFDYLVRLLYSL